MSRSRAIETRLEKLIPSLDEYFTSGFLTRAETQAVARQRTHWEYRLVAKPLLMLDVRNAVTYELELEERLREYCATTKLHLRHRWTILERVEGIYRIGLKHLRDPQEKEALRREYILFLKSYSRTSSLSKSYAEWLMQFPTRPDLWVEAMLWEGVEQRKMDDARAMAQQALLTMAGAPEVWACALKLELHFAGHLLDGLVQDEQEARTKRDEEAQPVQPTTTTADESTDPATTTSPAKVPPTPSTNARSGMQVAQDIAATLRQENAAMGTILLDLALAKAVVEEALASPCSGPALVERLLHVAGEYAFAEPVTQSIANLAMTQVVKVAMNPTEDRQGRKLQGGRRGGDGPALDGVAAQRVRSAWLSSTPITPATATSSSSSRPLAGGVDLVCRGYLALPALQLYYRRRTDSGTTTTATEPVSYMACALDGPAGRAEWELTAVDRERIVLSSLVAVLDFFLYVPLNLEARNQMTIESRARAQAVRQLLNQLVPSSTVAPAAACVHRLVRDLLEQLAPSQREGVSAVCRRLLAMSSTAAAKHSAWPSLKQLALSLAHLCIGDSQPINKSAKENKRKGKKAGHATSAEEDADTERIGSIVEEAKTRVAAVLSCVLEDAAVAAPPTTRARHETATTTAAATALKGGEAAAEDGVLAAVHHWPVSLFGAFLTQADQDELVSLPPTAQPAGKTSKLAHTPAPSDAAKGRLTEESIDLFMTWWRTHFPSTQTSSPASPVPGRKHGGEDDDEAHADPIVVTDAAHLLETRRQCREKAARLLSLHLPAAKSTDTSVEATLCRLRARPLPFIAASPSDGHSRFSVSSTAEAPLSLWRVFAALESLDGAEMAMVPVSSTSGTAAKSAQSRRASDSDSDDDSSDDEASAGARKAAANAPYTNYATAGIAFLASASSGSLSRAGEWERVQGIHALLRCRLESLTGRSAAVVRHDELVELLLESALPTVHTPQASGVDGAWLPGWMQDILVTVREAQKRCHPLSRLSFMGIIIPVYEAIAEVCVAHPQKFLHARCGDVRQTTQHWLAEARSAHEQLLALYGMSRHVESFVPLLFNGKRAVLAAQSDRVTSANADDWLSYVAFERNIAKDLTRSAAVAERARRHALNAQEVLVKLVNLS